MSSKLDAIIAKINKDTGQEVITRGTAMIYVKKIPFSSPRANYMTYGGIPIGKSTEVFGPESGGKTTLAIDVVGNAQKLAQETYDMEHDRISSELNTLIEKNNKSDKQRIKKLQSDLQDLESAGVKKVLYVDAENTLDEDWAELNGVDTQTLILYRPEDQTAEDILQYVLDMIETGDLIMVVIDSLPMLVSQNLYDEDLSKKSYGGIAGVLTDFSRKVSPILKRNETALLCINQSREDLNNPYNKYHTPGGRAIRHLHALRIYCQKGSYLNEMNEELANSKAETPVGNKADLRIVKTKVCKPNRLTGFHTINYEKGIDALNDTIEMAMHYGFIVKAGSWFTFIDPETGEIMTYGDGTEIKFQGRAKLVEFLTEDEDLYEEIYDAVDRKVTAI